MTPSVGSALMATPLVRHLPACHRCPRVGSLQAISRQEQVCRVCGACVQISPKYSEADVCASVSGWALAMSTSRAFRVRGAEQPAAQLPLIDMCNHSFAPNCQVFVRCISGSHLPGLWPGPWQQIDACQRSMHCKTFCCVHAMPQQPQLAVGVSTQSLGLPKSSAHLSGQERLGNPKNNR